MLDILFLNTKVLVFSIPKHYYKIPTKKIINYSIRLKADFGSFIPSFLSLLQFWKIKRIISYESCKKLVNHSFSLTPTNTIQYFPNVTFLFLAT